MSGRTDLPSLIAGLVLVALGAILLADARGGLDLTIGAAAPMVCAAVGAVLVATGLSRGR